MSEVEEARHLFKNNYNCAQAVAGTTAPKLGIDQENILKLSCAFGGGMARMQEVCGAVTGAFMCIGLAHAKVGAAEISASKMLTYEYVRQFTSKFKEKYGTINCKELLENLDMNNEKDQIKLKELQLHDVKCTAIVSDAVEILNKLI